MIPHNRAQLADKDGRVTRDWYDWFRRLSDVFDPKGAGESILSSKQDKLVSGANLKTINGESLLGYEDIVLAGGSDPWTYIKLSSDFTTNSATQVPITGLAFAPEANKQYEFEACLFLRTATATVGPRPAIGWATIGLADGVADIYTTTAAGTEVQQHGNVNAAILAPVGGLPNTTQSYSGRIYGSAIMGASPAGNIQISLASETAGTNVTAKAGSYLKYREI